MKATLTLGIMGAVLLLSACGDGQADAAKQLAAVADSAKAASVHSLASYGMPLEVVMPEGTPPPVIQYREETGELSVQAGEHFGLVITEGPADMARLKGDLERDLLRKNTILQETPDLLIFRSEFPDDTTLTFHRFHRSVAFGGRTFSVRDAENGTAYSLEDVQRMIAAVQPRQAV